MILDIMLIATIVCFVIDVSGIIESVEWYLTKLIEKCVKIPKPFSCSLCMTFWIGLIWIIIKDFSLLNLVYLSVISALTENIGKAFILIRLSIGKLEDILIKIITRN